MIRRIKKNHSTNIAHAIIVSVRHRPESNFIIMHFINKTFVKFSGITLGVVHMPFFRFSMWEYQISRQSTSKQKGCMYIIMFDTVDIPFSYGRGLIIRSAKSEIFKDKRKYCLCDLKCRYCVFTLWGRSVLRYCSNG